MTPGPIGSTRPSGSAGSSTASMGVSRTAKDLIRRVPVNRSTAAVAARLTAASALRRLPFPLRPQPVPGSVTLPQAKRTLGADYDTEWARRYPARMARVLVLQGLVRPAMQALASPTVHGLDRLHDLEGPAIFAANHHSHIDTPLVLSTIPEPWRHHLFVVAAADYFFGNKVTAPLSALVIGAIPIERQKIGRKSADDAADLLGRGWSMLIFPEGGRSPDGWGQPFRGGAAYLALRVDLPVVPIHVEGTGRILRKGRTVPSPSPTTITFGAPMRPADGEDSRKFGARIEAEVAALADEDATDWYQARKRAHAKASPSLQGPDGDVGAWRRTWALGDRGPKRRRPGPNRWPDLS